LAGQAGSEELPQSIPPRPGRLRSATTTIRDTTKWILTGFTWLASVLVAGLRFADVGKLRLWHGPFYLAVLGTVVSFAGLASIVWLASRVLSTQFDTLRQILSSAAATKKRKPHLPVEVSDELISAIVADEDYLYRKAAIDLTDLFSQIQTINNEGIQLRRDNIVLSPAKERRRQVRIVELNEALERVVDFADHWITKKRFGILLKGLLTAGILTTSGVFVFALGVSRPADPTVQFEDRPVPARIFLTLAGQRFAASHLGCGTKMLDGVIVGRVSSDPQVVTPEQAGCRPARFIVKDRLGVVVPTIAA